MTAPRGDTLIYSLKARIAALVKELAVALLERAGVDAIAAERRRTELEALLLAAFLHDGDAAAFARLAGAAIMTIRHERDERTTP